MQFKKELLSLLIVSMVSFSIMIPAYGEVTALNINKTFFVKGEKIEFSGTVEEGDSGLVTIVIYDSKSKFVMLAQANINADETFKKTVDTKERFTDQGIHNATAFVVNMAEGKSIRFDFSLDGSKVSPSVSDSQKSNQPIQEQQNTIQETNQVDTETDDNSTSTSQTHIETNQTSTETNQEKEDKSKLAPFVDPEKDPQHYIDRYYNEPKYQEWFDRNYPDWTIEEAVGLDITKNEIKNATEIKPNKIIPTAAGSTLVNPPSTSFEIDGGLAQIGLVLGGLGVLFAAIYGIKRHAGKRSNKIFKNDDKEKTELFGSYLRHDPFEVIKSRLAQGEITIDEYYELRRALKEN